MNDEEDDSFSLPQSGKEWDIATLRVAVALLRERCRNNKSNTDDLKKELLEKYVSKDEFKPVMRLVYGITALILVTVITAIVNALFKVHP